MKNYGSFYLLLSSPFSSLQLGQEGSEHRGSGRGVVGRKVIRSPILSRFKDTFEDPRTESSESRYLFV